jgi:hypothetical protein
LSGGYTGAWFFDEKLHLLWLISAFSLAQSKMNLPNAENARVEKEKITAYLLNAGHPYGSSKASFFTRFGFTLELGEAFAERLRDRGSSHPVSRVTETVFGPRYNVDGKIVTPDGRNPTIRTVWQMDHGELAPRLITAYPIEDLR